MTLALWQLILLSQYIFYNNNNNKQYLLRAFNITTDISMRKPTITVSEKSSQSFHFN